MLATIAEVSAINGGARGEPIWRCVTSGIYVVESYALATEVFSKPADYSSKTTLSLTDAEFPAAEVEAIYRAGGCLWTRTLQTNDPPSHKRFRSLVERVFTVSKVDEMAGGIERTCDQLLAQWPIGERVDAMERFAVPLPLAVIAEQLGMPSADLRSFKRWSDAAIRAIGLGATREQHLEAARCGIEFQQYFRPVLEDERRRPAGSLVDRVARAASQPEFALTLAEQLSLLHMLMIAGHETTTSTLGSLLRLFAERPDFVAAARVDAAVAKRLIEEALRLHTPVQGLFRITTREVELGGVSLPPGAILSLRLGAANRDPARYPQPVAEPRLVGTVPAHLAFGAGIHHCIGASLARRELAIAVARVLARFERLEVPADAYPLPYTQSVMTRSLVSLPMIGYRHAEPARTR